MKKIYLFLFATIMLVSCNSGKNVAPFEIGDSRDVVINTIANDFTICGEHWSKERILDREHLEHNGFRKVITLYECKYNGQEYYKVRVYFSYNKISRMELVIEKDKMKSLHKRLRSKYGEAHRTSLPRGLAGLPPMWETSTVYLGDIDGVIVTEDDQDVVRTRPDGTTTEEHADTYELIIVSGEQYYELKRFI